MIGASIYGFVDYKKSSHRKDFKEMYKEEQTITPVEDKTDVAEIKTTEPAKTISETKTVKSKVASTNSKEEITAIDPISTNDKMEVSKTSLDAENKTTLSPSKESSIVKVIKKKRRIKSNLFSRAPLRDEEVEIRVPVKTETKTEVKKEDKKD